MAEPAEPARPAYAVCPRIERNVTTRTPLLFPTEADAIAFLSAEVEYPLEPEAEMAGITVEEVRERRKERDAARRMALGRASVAVSKGELDPFAFPAHLQPRLNAQDGWEDPVRLTWLADYTGPKCSRIIRDLLPSNAADTMPALDMEDEIERAIEDRDARYACCLGEDWRFDEIVARARRDEGHEYAGLRHANIGDIGFKAVHDLGRALRKIHPDAPCAAVADFCRSWQVQHYMADFCFRLGKSDTAKFLASDSFAAAEQAYLASVHIFRQLAVVANQMRENSETLPEEPRGAQEPVARSPRKRGRPQTIPVERKAAALAVKEAGGTNRQAAQALYEIKYPTPQQVKNVTSILRHYRGSLSSEGR